MKTKLWIAAGVFGVLTLIFFFSSLISVDTGHGTYTVANIQSTVFCAACFVSAVICAVGALVIESIENSITEQHSRFRQMFNRLSMTEKSNNTPQTMEINNVRNENEENDVTKPISVKNETLKKQESADPKWIIDEFGMVNCPSCNTRMSIDYIKVRKKCPECGCTYLD